ncbi:MAG: hypothetical protein GF329_15930 [Candidatus Lokiarchaeota archaeon]|nr:hypothetical protein [Candidatus Lokiarchaeota archaeon]
MSKIINPNSIIFKDRDFILSKDNLFFCVVGYDHPTDRAICYLKYSPKKDGKWKMGDRGLKRMLPHYSAISVKNTFDFLKDFPDYIFEDNINNITISAVPINLINKYYDTQNKVKELINKQSLDVLQKKVLELIEYISLNNDLSFENFGLTGSILINIHNPKFSDIDLTIIGQDNSRIIKKTLNKEFSQSKNMVQFKNKSQFNQWIERKSKQFNINRKIIEKIAERQWNFGYFNNTRFSVHPVKSEEEIINKYGREKYIYEDLIKIRARVNNTDESMFLPAKYEISDFEVIKGKKVEYIKQIISYEGLYCDILLEEEEIEAFGKLEKVINLKTEKSYHRLVIGSFEANETDYLTYLKE